MLDSDEFDHVIHVFEHIVDGDFAFADTLWKRQDADQTALICNRLDLIVGEIARIIEHAAGVRVADDQRRSGGVERLNASVMDATAMTFPDDSFDVIVAQYVITAVPDPEATLDEFARVLKPGGEIVLVNHIGAENGARKAFELAFAPLARRLGWRPEFPWERLTAWNERVPSIRFIERKPMPPLGHFSLIRYGKEAVAG